MSRTSRARTALACSVVAASVAVGACGKQPVDAATPKAPAPVNIGPEAIAVVAMATLNSGPAISGSLVAELDGQSISLIGFNKAVPADLDGSLRRSVYLPVIRNSVYGGSDASVAVWNPATRVPSAAHR